MEQFFKRRRSVIWLALLVSVQASGRTAIAAEEMGAETPPNDEATPASQVPSARELIGFPDIWSVHLSPDGESLAWLSEGNNQDSLTIASVKDRESRSYPLHAYTQEFVTGHRIVPSTTRVATRLETMPGRGATARVTYVAPTYVTRPDYGFIRIERRARTFHWCNPDVVLLSLRTGTLAFSIERQWMEPLWGLEREDPSGTGGLPFSPRASLISAPGAADHVYVFGRRMRDQKQTDLWKCHVTTGRFSRVATNPGPVAQWFPGPDETSIVGIGEVDDVRRVFLRSASSGELAPAGDLGPASAMCQVIGYDAARGLVYALRSHGDFAVLSTFDLAARAWSSEVTSLPSYDIVPMRAPPRLNDINLCGPVFSRRDGRLLGWRVMLAQMHTMWFDTACAAHQQVIDNARPGWTNLVLESNIEESRLLVLSFSGTAGALMSVFDTESGSLWPFVSLGPDLPRWDVIARPVKFTAPDRTPLTGWITLQPERFETRPPRSRPLVVLLRADPFEPSVGCYDDLACFLATRGYAVLQLNHRGTSGRGAAFLEEGARDLGANVPSDLASAVAELVASGHIAGSRITVIGSGYGAHLALRALAMQKDVFACGVAISPVVDWSAVMRSSQTEARRHWSGLMDISKERDDAATLTAQSAVTFARELSQPLLIVQGSSDTIAPSAPVDRFAKRLQKMNTTVERLTLKRASFDIPEQGPRAEMFERIAAFLAQYMGEPASPARLAGHVGSQPSR